MEIGLSLSLTSNKGVGGFPYPAPSGLRWQQVFKGSEPVMKGTQYIFKLERAA